MLIYATVFASQKNFGWNKGPGKEPQQLEIGRVGDLFDSEVTTDLGMDPASQRCLAVRHALVLQGTSPTTFLYQTVVVKQKLMELAVFKQNWNLRF